MFSVMENKMKQKGERGSMMMEYVIVTAAIGMALVIYLNRSFFDFRDGFGEMGQMVVAFFERTVGGLSLPIP